MERPRRATASALTLLIALAAPLSAGTSVSAQARPASEAAAEVASVREHSLRRRALAVQLQKQRAELARHVARASALRAQLDDPKNAQDGAAEARASLLTAAASEFHMIAYYAGQLQAGQAELSELEGAVSELVAGAEARAAAVDASTPAGRGAAQRAKQHALRLRTLAALGPASTQAQKQAQLDKDVAGWKQQQHDAQAMLAAIAAEPMYAKLTETPPRNAKPASAKGKGAAPQEGSLKACNVREVDWKNITITVAGTSILLIDGEGPVQPTERGTSVGLKIKRVDFGDTNQNGRDEVFLLADREEYTQQPTEVTRHVDALYVYEAAPDCSMRRLAELTLAAGGEDGKAVAGGYDYEGASEHRSYRWVDGTLREQAVRAKVRLPDR